MAIKTQCPDCNRTISGPESYEGKTVKCPNCGASVRLLKVSSKVAGPGSTQIAAALVMFVTAVFLLLQLIFIVMASSERRVRVMKATPEYREAMRGVDRSREPWWADSYRKDILLEEYRSQMRKALVGKPLVMVLLIVTGCLLLAKRPTAAQVMAALQSIVLFVLTIMALSSASALQTVYNRLGTSVPAAMYYVDMIMMCLWPVATAASIIAFVRPAMKIPYSERYNFARKRKKIPASKSPPVKKPPNTPTNTPE